MRALENIDLAFVCMNLPFTMDANAAASAVSEFAPTYVYPYHYRGRDGGTQDPEAFAKMVGNEIESRNWAVVRLRSFRRPFGSGRVGHDPRFIKPAEDIIGHSA